MNRPTGDDAPPPADGLATASQAFWRGMATIATTPAIILFATSIGFGALARDLGFTFGHAAMLSLGMYALPAQVMLVDQLARGTAVLAAAFAVSLTAIRLLPMTVSLLPYLRSGPRLTALHWLAAHMVAVTSWLEGNRRLPQIADHLRLPHFLGIGTAMMGATLLGTVAGFGVAGSISPRLSAVLLFVTPLYFLLSLGLGARLKADWIAIGAGIVLGPLLFWLLPGPDLLLTGVIGGTIAVALGRRRP